MLKFLKSAILNGLAILLPILLLIVIISEFFQLLVGLATPIADLLPRDTIESVPETNLLAVLLIVGSAFIVGVLAMVPFGAKAGQFLERAVLNRVPVYVPLKALLNALLRSDNSRAYLPAFIQGSSGELEPAYIVEDAGRARLMVLVPWTPNSFAGSLKLVPRDRVFPVDLTFDQFSLMIGHYGLGLTDLLPDAPEELRLGPKGE